MYSPPVTILTIGQVFQEILDAAESSFTDAGVLDSHLNAKYDLYKKQLRDENPFFPMLEGLQGTRDEKRVLASFKHSYVLYEKIVARSRDLEPARLYKLGAVGTASEVCKQKLSDATEAFETMTLQEVLHEIEKMKASEGIETRIVGNALFKELKNIQEAYQKPAPATKKTQLGLIYKRVFKTGISNGISLAFFKTDKNKKELESLGAVYKPESFHSWGANLGWVLAHLRRGNTFIVCSEVLRHQYRRGYQSVPCAFAKEFCAALKAGYTLCKTENQVTLEPIGLSQEYLKGCDSRSR